MLAVDEDLRHRGTAAGAADHLVAPPRLLDDVDRLVGDALSFEQRAGARAIGAEHRRVDLDLGHRRRRSESACLRGTVFHIWRESRDWAKPNWAAQGCGM